MNTIRGRLSLNTLIVLTLGMTLTAVLSWQSVSGLYTSTQRDNLLAQAKIIATALQGQVLPENPQPYSQTSNFAPGIHTRLLSDEGGVVIGLPFTDAVVQMPPAEQNVMIQTSELIQRPEIASALKGMPATAIRNVLGTHRMLYAAAPIYSGNGQITSIVYIATPLPATGLPVSILLQLIGAISIAVVLTSLAGEYLARQISSPLEGLSNASKAIAGGNLKVHAPVDTKIKELQGLGQTFNDMIENLNRSDEAKKAFTADITHELRTPLTVIKGTIETLEDGAIDDLGGRGPLLAAMGRETDRLIRLVNELLVLTRADAGTLQVTLGSLDLLELAKQRCENLSGIATRRGVKILINSGEDSRLTANGTTDGRPRSIIARADPDRLSQVLDNLLENAIRHSPPNSTITVRITGSINNVECSVIDLGSGISAEHIPFIFERFYRVDKSRDRKDGGTGLGLAIVRALIRAQGGNIYAHSVFGKGTTITFCLQTPSSPNIEADARE